MSQVHRHFAGGLCTPAVILCISMFTYVRAEGVHEESRRQDPVPTLPAPVDGSPTSSTTFDYWWPYPPQTYAAPSTSAATLLAESATLPSDTDMTLSAPISTSSLTNISNMSTAASLVTSSGFTSDTTLPQNSSSSSISIITITALPPSSTPSPPPPSPYHELSNPLRFTPIFAVVGGILGLACGWLLYEFWTRRRRKARRDDITGPRYTGIDDNGNDEEEILQEKRQEGILPTNANNNEIHDNTATPNHQTRSSHLRDAARVIDVPPTERTAESNWLQSNFLTILRSPLSANTENARNGSPRYDNDMRTPASRLLNNHEERASLNGRSPIASTVFSSVTSSDEDEDYADSQRNMTQGTIRHKSIRSRIADSFRAHFSPRSKPRAKSRGRTPELEEGVLLSNNAENLDESPLAAASARRKKTNSRHGRAISDFDLTRGDLTPPSRTHLPKSISRGLMRYTLRDEPAYANTSAHFDKFTPMPHRKTRSPKKRTVKERLDVLSDSEASPSLYPAVDPNVLPASPPRLSSSVLESELMFSPSSVSLPQTPPRTRFSSSQARTYASDEDSPVASPPKRGPTGPRHPRKLVSRRSPTRQLEGYDPRNKALPPSPPRRSGAKSASNSPYKRWTNGDSSTRARSNTDSSYAVSPKERYEARHSALDKVSSIMSQSWSTRNVLGMPAPSSPTMFGAQADSQLGASLEEIKEESGLMLSIEQTLGPVGD